MLLGIQNPTGSGFSIKDFTETLIGGVLAREEIRSGQRLNTINGQGNTVTDHPRVQTGVNSDGSTILPRTQIVSGIDNGVLLIGGVLVAIAVTVAIKVA